MADGSHDESHWIQTVDLFIPETQPPKWAHIPQTIHLQTLWSLKYSIGTAWLGVKQAAAVSTQQNETSLCKCGSLVLFGQSSWSPSARWIMVLWCQQTAASSKSSVSLEPFRPPLLQCMVDVVSVDAVFAVNQRDAWLDWLESGEQLFPCQHVGSCWVWCAVFPEKTEPASSQDDWYNMWRGRVCYHWRAGTYKWTNSDKGYLRAYLFVKVLRFIGKQADSGAEGRQTSSVWPRANQIKAKWLKLLLH